jgi:hypothetical protein
MEAVNEAIKLIAQAKDLLCASKKNDEVFCLLESAIDILSLRST